VCRAREAKGELGPGLGRGGSASLRLFVEDVVKMSCTRLVAALITTFEGRRLEESRGSDRMSPLYAAKRRKEGGGVKIRLTRKKKDPRREKQTREGEAERRQSRNSGDD
jgi:hypothetical protein